MTKAKEKKPPIHTYYFFTGGEILDGVDARTDEEALKLFKQRGFKQDWTDCFLKFNRKTGGYALTRLKKKSATSSD